MTASLYLHVPFCAGACDYCDFYSIPARAEDDLLDKFVDILLKDVHKSIHYYQVDALPSVYIGGGTPSLLGAERCARLLAAIQGLPLASGAEITIEANPESATDDFLRACADGGATRLSLGIQSTDARSRGAVGRIGEVDQVRRAVGAARRLFPGSLCLDLISGLPFQDERSLLGDISFAVDSGADHVSLYALTLEDGTPLAKRHRRGAAALPNEDAADELWLRGRDALEAAGLLQYEVSNFSRPGKESVHNSRYWRMESYLGCGPSAVGTIVDEDSATAERLSWPADADAWLRRPEAHEPAIELIPRKALIEECLLMGFRTTAGVDEALFSRRFARGVEIFIGGALERRRAGGLAALDRPALNRDGLATLNGFLVDCLMELDATYPKYEESLR